MDDVKSIYEEKYIVGQRHLAELAWISRRRTIVLRSVFVGDSPRFFASHSVWNGLYTDFFYSVIIYSPSCRSKPVRSLFIFGTQIIICLMKSESSLTLHRQQCNWNVPRPRKVVMTAIKYYMWHQWFNRNFTKLHEYFLFCTQKVFSQFHKITVKPLISHGLVY